MIITIKNLKCSFFNICFNLYKQKRKFLHKLFFDSRMSINRGEIMEFFRKHQKAIVAVIALTFIAWTVGLMMLPLLFR